MKKLLVLFFALCFFAVAYSQEHPMASGKIEPALVHWLTFEQAVEKSKTEKRSIFIDVYTDWCGWCKVMDKNTFNEPIVAKMLNEKYYPVKFNAEQREDIVYNGTTFKYLSNGNSGVHQLAVALLNNQLSYPTVVFMDRELKTVFPLAGYRKPDEFHKYLSFFSEDQTKNGENAWKLFEEKYKSPYAATPPSASGGN